MKKSLTSARSRAGELVFFSYFILFVLSRDSLMDYKTIACLAAFVAFDEDLETLK